MKQVAYIDQLCERCGSKRKVAKTWKETMLTFTGRKTVVEYSQIVCTNSDCQKEFDKVLANETKKRLELQLKKDENLKIRKEAMSVAKSAKSLNKNRSRI